MPKPNQLKEERAALQAKIDEENFVVQRSEAEKFKAEAEYYLAQANKERWLSLQEELTYLRRRRDDDDDNAMNKANRVLDISTTISPGSVENASQRLYALARLSKDPITIRFTSPGGNVMDGFALYDVILAIRSQGIVVTTIALGTCASMAAVLLQSGTYRLVGPNAWVLVHEISSGAIGKISEMQDEVDLCNRLNAQVITILGERSNITKEMMEERAKRRDWWLNSRECVDLKLADNIYKGQV